MKENINKINSQNKMIHQSSQPLQHDKISKNILNRMKFDHYIQAVQKSLHPIRQIFCLHQNRVQYQKLFREKIQKLQYNNEDLFKKKLFIDLDETLIHCIQICPRKQGKKVKKEIIVQHPIKCSQVIYTSNQKVFINIRPHCYQFLQQMQKYYDIIAFTASNLQYAQVIVNFLNSKTQNSIKHILSRQNCLKISQISIYFKDLRIFSNINLTQSIIVDNFMGSFYFNLNNGVPISSFFDNSQNDHQLIKVGRLLKQVYQLKDVRCYLEDRFKLKQVIRQKE